MAPVLPTNRELISFCKERISTGIRFFRFSDTVAIKFGTDVTEGEAATQLYVWKHIDPTIFRVPEPYRYFQDEPPGGSYVIGYLVMEYIDGICLSEYLESVTSKDDETVVDCIIKALHHLEAIPLPVGQGPGPIGSSHPRGYLWGDDGIATSFASITEMENWLNDLVEKYQKFLPTSKSKDKFIFTPAKLVMCHGDLAPRNILWLGDGQLALLDWGNAGFYPQVFEVYAFRTRENREPIFAKILSRLTQQEDDEEQIQRLAKIEYILLHHGNSINYNLTHKESTNITPRQIVVPPPFKPGSIF